MISGLFKGDIGDTYPRAIELYAFEDIPDLSVYGIEIASNGNQPTGQMFNLNNVSVSELFIVLINLKKFNIFTPTIIFFGQWKNSKLSHSNFI